MADRMLFISWGQPVRGREERGLEVFNDAMGLYGRMQQDGRIEGFDVCLLTPTAGLNGYIELHGSEQQLTAVQQDEDYQRTLIAAELVCDQVCVAAGYTNEGIAPQMAMYQEEIGKVPQSA